MDDRYMEIVGVYPRVCGGTPIHLWDREVSVGSYPRVCGGTADDQGLKEHNQGLSRVCGGTFAICA